MAIVSVGLFIAGYISLGWGSALTTNYGLAFAIVGATSYFISLVIAVRSQMKWLVAIIATLGIILGLLVLVVSVEAFIDLPGSRRWLPACVVSVLVATCLGILFFFKVRRKGQLSK